MEKNKFTHGSLFSGIGGPEIAAEEMGWKNMFHCEINPFGRKILDYWFPNSKSYEDITKTNFTECRGSGGTPHESCCENERQNGYETQQPFVRGCVRASSHSDGERCNNRSDNWKERPICYDQKRDSEENQSERTERKRRTCENGSVASYSQCPGSGQVQQEIQSEQSNGHSFDSNGGEWDAPYSSSEGLSTLRFPTSIEKKKWENEDGCSVQPAGNVRRASFAERWKNFPTQSPVCSRDDGISTRLDGIAFSKWRQESIKAYGNAIVPQVMYEIFQAIQETYNQ